MTPADPLLAARALVLDDLAAQSLVDPHTVSVVEDCIASRRWWLSQWQPGADFIAGLVAQDVQDVLFDEAQRWPLCDTCPDPAQHSLRIEPELGADPHWVCSSSGTVIAALGQLAAVPTRDP